MPGHGGFFKRGRGRGGRGFGRGRFRGRDDRKDRNYQSKSESGNPASSPNVRIVRNAPTKVVIENLTETEIGVTEFVSPLPGFTGLLKARFSDFHVNEIDLDGTVAKLTKLLPDYKEEELVEDDEELVRKYRLDLFPIETWDKIHKMTQTIPDDPNEKPTVELEVTAMTKDERRNIHTAIQQVFGQKIISNTVDKDDKKFIIFKKFSNQDLLDRRKRWPESYGGEYVHFLVYKEGIDTLEVTIQLSDRLHVKPASFCYAGVKDRRAVTTQWFGIRKVEPNDIVRLTKGIRNIAIGNFCFKTTPLKLGHLKGNRFRIAIRNVTAEDDVINSSLEMLKEKGFINYYGLQRFGNYKEAPTHQIGLELMKSNWKEACALILKPRKHEYDASIARAKKVYEETGDAMLAYTRLNRKKDRCMEAKLLYGLVKNSKNDYVNALEKIPRNMRLLYIHAYQSLIWNKVVSKRIKDFGMKPIIGDMVMDEELEEFSVNNDFPKDAGEEPLKSQKIKYLTESDLDNYTIYDVILPLPGYDIKYPENTMTDYYKELLESDGLSLEMTKQKVRTYTLSGAYRKIMERVSDLSWRTMRYPSNTSDLIRSDLQELKGVPEIQDDPNATNKALILDFCLTSSCYATMAIREIMKMDTSIQTHINFGNNFKDTESETTDEVKVEATTDENVTDKIKVEPKASDVVPEQSTNKETAEKRKIEDAPEPSKKPKLEST